MSDSPVSIGAALGYAWSLWRSHWREIWGALALNALACTVLCAGIFANNPMLVLGGLIALLFTRFAVYGSTFRLAFAADHPNDDQFAVGNLGIQWRGAESKMFVAGFLIVVFFAILLMLMAFLLACVLGALLYSHGVTPADAMKLKDPFQAAGPSGLKVRDVGYSVMQLVLTLVGIRLSLSFPATADSGRIQVLRTWRLTRGHFWQLFFATLVLELPSALIMMIGAGAALPLNGQPAPLAPGETFLYSLICGGWAGAAAMPLTAGVQAYFYRNLKTDV
jgi:hypothetical protein